MKSKAFLSIALATVATAAVLTTDLESPLAGSAERWNDVSTHDPAFQMIQPIRFGGEFGTSVAAGGGLNHDGIQDILAGVPLHSNFGAVGTADFNGDGTPRSWSGVRVKMQI